MVTQVKRSAFVRALRQRVRGEVAADEMSRGLYATDASIYQLEPVAVVSPLDEADAAAAVAAAAEFGISIVPRGGGTSLGGQAVGEGLVLDFTPHMNRVLELNVEEHWVRVQPGVVRDNLNAELAPHGLLFAPDPATTSRAAVGGMIGNNSSGTKSLIYGKTVDHALETKVLLPDGATLEFRELSAEEYGRQSVNGTRQAEVLRGFKRIVDANRDEIDKRFPKIMRRVSGYNLDEFIHTDRWNLSKLVTGSEGTLGVILEAKLNLEFLPKATGLCIVHFTELHEAVRAVREILEYGPSAVEILDRALIELARKNHSIARLCDFMEGEPQALLVVEFFGETPDEVRGKQEGLIADLKAKGLGFAYPLRNDGPGMARVWSVRKSGLGLLLGMKGDRKPLAFIEDASVPARALPEYIDRVIKLIHANGAEVAMYAHAGVGLIHVRPILDLRRQEDIDRMKAIADGAFEMVKEYGGSWCGEHGDGRVRSPFIERFFGSQVYGAFKEIKTLFDPRGLMNPGIIVDAAPMDQNLRYGTTYRTPSLATEYHYREDGSFPAAVELCTGVGACRQTLDGTMCPSFRVTRDEEHSTRGRANALRLAMTGQLGPDGLAGKRLFDVFDLCLSCKACKSECPSNVDVARLKGEFLQKYHDAHGATAREKMVGGSTRLAPVLAGPLAPAVNWLQGTAAFRKVLEKTIGIDSRRVLPAYASRPFPKWFARRNGSGGAQAPSRGKVVLFDDTYMNFFEPDVGISAVELLESCGYEVVPARAGCCQRPRISHGFLREAKREGEKTLRNLDAFIQQGLEVVCCEPGCASALTDDLPDLIDDVELGERIKGGVLMLDEFLECEIAEGRLECGFTSRYSDALVHTHCHQKSLFSQTAVQTILGKVEGLKVRTIDSGCCGMAGSFGYEQEHYDVSMRIGEDRLFPAVRNRPEGAAIVAAGFSCRHQIAHGTGVRAVHWVETVRGGS